MKIPRSIVSIVVQVLGDDGSLLSCAANAVCMALMDAGVAMKALAMSVTCAQLDDGSCLLDPTQAEELRAKAVIVLVHESTTNNVIASFTDGAFSVDQFSACVEGSAIAVQNVVAFTRLAVEQKISKEQLGAIDTAAAAANDSAEGGAGARALAAPVQ